MTFCVKYGIIFFVIQNIKRKVVFIIKRFYLIILIIPLMLFSIFTVFGDTGNIQNKTITEEPTVKDDIILGVNLDEGTETVPPK